MTDLPYRLVNEAGPTPMVIICDHASNRVPADDGDLGLNAPAIPSTVRRLLIDCNRRFEDPNLTPAVSDGTELAGGRQPVVLSIHSVTATMRGAARPWQIAVCWDTDQRLSVPMLRALRAHDGIVVGDNEPYSLDPAEDYSVPVHATRRGLKHLQIEFRQDEGADATGNNAVPRCSPIARNRC